MTAPLDTCNNRAPGLLLSSGATNLAADMIGVVTDAAKFSPRSRQVAIGPSEIGSDCQRQLALKLVNAPVTWQDSDPWASIIGTATHAWLASAFSAVNLILDEPRWLVEQRVHPNPGISGSCDLYDLWTDTVIDHKIVGNTTLADVKKNGPTPQYQGQANIYGLGWERIGRSPKEIAIAYWPRSGYLSGLYLHRQPYDRQLATNLLDRLTNISAAAVALEIDEYPERAMLIPASPGTSCKYCPYKSWKRNDGGCPDAPGASVPTSIPGI